MMRVLTLSTLFPDASRPNFGIFVERQTLGLAARADVGVAVVAPVGLPPFPLSRLPRHRALAGLPTKESRSGLNVWRPRFRTLPGTGGRFHAPALHRALVPLLDTLRERFPFDVIDAEFFFPDGPAAIALGRRYGVPVSIKARGADIHHWGHAPATTAQVAAAARRADGILAVSGAMADDIAALGPPRERIAVHRTGVDHQRFAAGDGAARIGRPAAPLILSVGALIPRKGHHILVDALLRLPTAHLWIAGEGEDRRRLAARIAARGLQSRVRLLGAVPHADLPPLFAAADVMALASASEGLANAWVEALASGTPIVITDVGGARELLANGDAGRIAPRTPKGFAAAIADLLARPPDAESVRAAAAPYSWQANAEALHDHLARLVRSHRG
ncbi:glycosyltransferase [Stakelama saccharophila]|uniref:Glycosyltransferase n=1 Tax=Stakelama saccharophila TaxID=3075605 RepID=A0ABZ0BB10_9SPHN|nr:glycosyltransferase [Stakelama sp. W311]WNO54392.1 glycosyltransferase [Stakelama sp. W311]